VTGKIWIRLGRIDGQNLDFATFEEIVFFAMRALGALQAADQQEGDSHCHQDGDEICVGLKPMK